MNNDKSGVWELGPGLTGSPAFVFESRTLLIMFVESGTRTKMGRKPQSGSTPFTGPVPVDPVINASVGTLCHGPDPSGSA